MTRILSFCGYCFGQNDLFCSVLFPKRSDMMINGSENANVSWLLNFRIHMF